MLNVKQGSCEYQLFNRSFGPTRPGIEPKTMTHPLCYLETKSFLQFSLLPDSFGFLRKNAPSHLVRCKLSRMVVVVVPPDPFRGMGRGGTTRRPSSRATPQGLDQRSKMEEVVPKMARRRGSDAGQSRKR